MLATVLVLLVLFAGVLYLMTPDERARLRQSVLDAIKHALRTALQRAPVGEPFDDLLRARTGWAVVTPALIALNVLTFMFMLFGRGALSDPQTLIAWGGNYAPRTTNGEWWRLIAATFVHGGLLHLLATIIALLPLGVVLERAVGRVAFAITYLAAGILAGLVSLWTTSAIGVGIGASGAIGGIYGLLFASFVWATISRPEVPFPFLTVKRIAAAAAVFFLYNLFTDHLGMASELAGLGTGFLAGLVVARGVTREKPAVSRAAMVMAATVVIAIVCAVPLRGIVDVRPEIARIADVEKQTAEAYGSAVARFKQRLITADDLAQMIDRTIIPALQAARARLKAITGVPREQEPFVTRAEQYFELREKSWRRRAVGLRQLDMNVLRDAERSEQAALEALRGMQAAN